MLRRSILISCAVALLANASPAHDQYHWLPAAPDTKARPWAVLLPRAAGVGRLSAGNQYWDLARWLNARGIDVLVIDDDAAAPRVPAARGKTGPKIAAVIADALADARGRQQMDPRCPGVAIGWSRGAEGVLTLASSAEGNADGVKAVIAYYPSVRGQEQPWHQSLPVLALQGTADGIAPAESLRSLVARRVPTPLAFDVRYFDGAKHRFDVAHPVDDPEGRTPGDYDAKASTEALAAIGAFLDKYAITPGGCALD